VAIIDTAREVEADLIVMGATRRLFTEQAWTSVSARVMEKTQCPLVLVPGLRGEDTGEIPRVEP
jgi:nucleotide-binding universal stress UspA family protein